MKLASKWQTHGKKAQARELIEVAAEGKAAKRRAVQNELEHAKRDGDAIAVGKILRRLVREQLRVTYAINCRPAIVAGKRRGTLRNRRLETLAGLTVGRPSYVARDGFSNFHFAYKSRGLANPARYRRHEAAMTVRYIFRDAAREIAGGGIVSNISCDPDTVASVFNAIEELERVVGSEDGSVYISVIVSLPAELEGEREALLADICGLLARYNLPFAGVLHAPDKNGDDRNYHAHIIYSLRQIRSEVDGSFSFASWKCSDLNDATFYTKFRAHIADRMNAAMERAGHSRRFTAKSKKDRGLTTPTADESKRGPGKKHRERRADDVLRLETEREWVSAIIANRTAILRKIEEIGGRQPDNRHLTISRLEQADEHIRDLQSVSRNQLNSDVPTAAVAHAQPLGHSRPGAAGESGRTMPPVAPIPASTDTPCDPTQPITPTVPVASPLAANGPNSSSAAAKQQNADRTSGRVPAAEAPDAATSRLSDSGHGADLPPAGHVDNQRMRVDDHPRSEIGVRSATPIKTEAEPVAHAQPGLERAPADLLRDQGRAVDFAREAARERTPDLGPSDQKPEQKTEPPRVAAPIITPPPAIAPAASIRRRRRKRIAAVIDAFWQSDEAQELDARDADLLRSAIANAQPVLDLEQVSIRAEGARLFITFVEPDAFRKLEALGKHPIGWAILAATESILPMVTAEGASAFDVLRPADEAFDQIALLARHLAGRSRQGN